jgi:DNA-binding response OmpR family regulator
VTFTREQIMQAVWDEHWWGSTRTLDTHMSTLRRKIGDDQRPTVDHRDVARRRVPVRGLTERRA